jgi:galactose-1-phosphate uridylyltransferase
LIEFISHALTAMFMDASGNEIARPLEVRTDPITLKQSRITASRALENERGTERLYHPPEIDLDESKCPFCPGNLETMTPCLAPIISDKRRLTLNDSTLIPNLFPYTEWSAVSLFDSTHHVEIGTASVFSYRDSFMNCAGYLSRVHTVDSEAIYMAITQNHLPGAGGSLVHPHLQVHATRQMSNNHRIIEQRSNIYFQQTGNCIFSDLLLAEQNNGERYIGSTGIWAWLSAFAPSGFYEIWGIAPAHETLLSPDNTQLWEDLARGVLNTQRFYKSLNRNAYNLSLISIEDGTSIPCLRVTITARSSYAPWVRSDFTGFEMAYGEMATFTRPETVAEMARPYWYSS